MNATTFKTVGRTLFLMTCLSAMAFAESVTLTGALEAYETDEDGNAISVMLISDDGREVVVDTSGEGAALLQHVGSRVTVEGSIASSEEGSDVITVSSFTLVDDSASDDGDGDGDGDGDSDGDGDGDGDDE